MPYVDGLPVASTVSVNDVLAIDQGGTPGVPGTSTTRQATLALILGGTPGTQYLPLIGGTLTGNLTLSSTLTMGSSIIRWGILPLAAGAPTAVGSGYVVGDVITLTGGAKVSVISVSGGAVTEFYVQQSGSYTTVPTGAIAQTSTTGGGTGFTCTPAFGPIAASIGAGMLSPGQGNFVLGYQAGNAITTAPETTLIGDYTGTQLTTGGFSTALGHRALGNETTGDSHVAVGVDAMRNTRGLTSNHAIGNNALRAWLGNFSIAIGQNTLQGAEAGSTSGTSNIGIGYQVFKGLTATTANNNIGVGNNIASGITTAGNNVFIGHGSALLVTTAEKNVFIGQNVGAAAVSSFENVFIGWQSGHVATGSGGTYVGYSTGLLVTSGGNNTIIGDRVGSATLTIGSGNILIGVSSDTDVAAASTSDTLKIQGNGSTAAISGTGLNTSTPAILMPGSLTTPKVSGVSNLTLGTGAALATNATTGMIFIPSCAGTPSGSIGALGGVALIFDSTANKIWIGVAGTWKSVAVA